MRKGPNCVQHRHNTTDQHIQLGARSFVYADDLCATAAAKDFINPEATVTPVLITLISYYNLSTPSEDSRVQETHTPCAN